MDRPTGVTVTMVRVWCVVVFAVPSGIRCVTVQETPTTRSRDEHLGAHPFC